MSVHFARPNILVTGTPGAGKTLFAKQVADNFDFKFLEISRIVQDEGFISGFDATLDCPILDEDRVREKQRKLFRETIAVLASRSSRANHG